MLIVNYLDPSAIRPTSILMAEVIVGHSTVTFSGNGPKGPARYAQIRSSRYVNSPIVGMIDGILWNGQLVPIMNELAATQLPYMELLGNIVSRVSLLEYQE